MLRHFKNPATVPLFSGITKKSSSHGSVSQGSLHYHPMYHHHHYVSSLTTNQTG